MAQDNEVALQVKTPDLSTPLLAATNYQIGQSNLQTAQQNRDIDQTKLTMLNRVNQGEGIQFQNQLIRDAAAHALDSDSWDAAMRAAADKGAPAAAQYVGRYTPLLQQRLFESYAGATPGSSPTAATTGAAPAGSQVAGGLGADDLDRRFQNVPPERMAGSLAKLNLISDALTGVRDQASWQAALQKLQAAGIQTGQYAGAPYSPLLVQQAYANIQPVRQYLQNRLTASNTGVPDPLIKNPTKTVSGVEYSVDEYGNKATPLTPQVQKVVPDAYDKQGNPLFYTEQGGLVRGPAPGTVSPAEAASRIDKSENNTGDPSAKNPRSSAMGDGQFIDSTWLDTVKSARPDLAKTLNDKQILALRSDPDFSHDMTTALATQNAGVLSKANLPVTTASLKIAHYLGAGAATKVLNAAPNTPMEQLVSPAVIAANPELAGQTAGGFAQKIIGQVGNDPVDTGAGQQVFHKGQFDAPKLVETDDGKGGTWRGMAQQDNRTGQWVSADEKRTPINSNNLMILPESMMGGGGGRNAQMVTRQLVAARDATTEIKNIVELPLEASTGWFGGAQNAQPHSLLTATKNVLAQKVTDQDVQDFNTSMIGMGKALAALESGGMQTNQALIAQFDRLALLQGDTNLTKMRKLATMRQQAENALEANLTSPFMGKEQKEFSKNLLGELRTAVPWTPSDVTKLQRSNNPTASLGDFAKSQGLSSYVVGQTYKDAKGNNAVYNGPGKWTPVAAAVP